nr:MAG TPA: hypothetical protein [Caudoviricetes sp.]
MNPNNYYLFACKKSSSSAALFFVVSFLTKYAFFSILTKKNHAWRFPETSPLIGYNMVYSANTFGFH